MTVLGTMPVIRRQSLPGQAADGVIRSYKTAWDSPAARLNDKLTRNGAQVGGHFMQAHIPKMTI